MKGVGRAGWSLLFFAVLLSPGHCFRGPSVFSGPRSGARHTTCLAHATLDLVKTAVKEGTTAVTRFRGLGLPFLFPPPLLQGPLASEEALERWLVEEAGCDLNKWGHGKAKSARELLEELRAGESFLRPEGTRGLKVAKVRVFDGDYELFETSQILDNGVVKERNKQLAEKFRPGETPLHACGRGVSEELGSIVGSNPAIHFLRNGEVVAWEETETSSSYPGLRSVYELYWMEAEIQGLHRAATGMRFYTRESSESDGHCEKIHVWEWKPRGPATRAPAEKRRMKVGLYSS